MSPRLDVAHVDLLGVLAYGELTAFQRLASDARLAPTVADQVALGTMAAAEFGHFQRLSAHLEAAGVDPGDAMAPFVDTFDAFHDSTQPKDWYEGLLKAYLGEGLATDFYREVSTYLTDAPTRALVQEVVADTGQAEFVVTRVKEVVATDPATGGRLALWGRRLVGEAVVQAQRVAVERDALLEVLVAGGDFAGLSQLLTRLTDAHTERMEALGLSA